MILDKKIDTKNKGKAIKDNSDGYNEATVYNVSQNTCPVKAQYNVFSSSLHPC